MGEDRAEGRAPRRGAAPRSTSAVLGAAGQLAVAAGFYVLALWCAARGVAGGSFGAAARAEAPGAFFFFLYAQLFIGTTFLARGLSVFAPGLRWRKPTLYGLCVFLALAVWMALERAAALARVVLAQTDATDRLVFGGLAVVLLAVLGTLLYVLVWPEIKERLDAARTRPD